MLKGKRKYVLLLLGFAIVAGYLVLNKVAPRFGYDSGADLVSTIGSNYGQSFGADPEKIQILMDEEDFKKIEKIRAKSIERGMIVNEGDSYVDVQIIHQGDTLLGEARLKGHMTDHLEGNKWSYRVKLKGDDRLFGVKRFSIQHPGTRNYAYEWAFHEMLKREDIIALHYDFIDVSLNGTELGIYAFEEHFAEELIEKNNKPAGAVLRFNPNLYWVGRENLDLLKLDVFEEYSEYHTSFLEAYDRGRVKKDSVLFENFLQAQELLEQFRNGEKSTSDIFDVKKLATYHAIIDLVGGYHSLDWSDIKYYLNSETGKIEPVGYESFGVRPIHQLAGNFMFRKDKLKAHNFHVLLFSDAEFYETYIQEVQRLSERSYLDKFMNEVDEQLQQKLSIVYGEFPYEDFNVDGYLKNQKMMKRCLEVPKAFHAYVHNYENDTLYLQMGNINTLPTEILEISVGGEDKKWKWVMPCKDRLQEVDYKLVAVKLNKKQRKKMDKGASIKIKWKVIGTEVTQKTEVFNFSNRYFQKRLEAPGKPAAGLVEVLEGDVARFYPGVHIISDTVEVQAKSIMLSPWTRLELEPTARLILNGAVYIKGDEDSPVLIKGGELVLKGADNARLEQVQFNGTSVKTAKNKVQLNSCVFLNQEGIALEIEGGKAQINTTLFSDIDGTGILTRGAELNSKGNVFYQVAQNGIESEGFEVSSQNDQFKNVGNQSVLVQQGLVSISGAEFVNSVIPEVSSPAVVMSIE